VGEVGEVIYLCTSTICSRVVLSNVARITIFWLAIKSLNAWKCMVSSASHLPALTRPLEPSGLFYFQYCPIMSTSD
jgi:hypothetical protein